MIERREKIQITHALKSDPRKLRTGLAWGIGKVIPSSGERAEPASRLW